MKTKYLMVSIRALLILSCFPVFSQAQQTETKPKIRVYYFHTNERCPIDQSVEDNTKNVIGTHFKKQVTEGTIDFRIINTDDKKNEKLISGYEINAQALYVVKIEKGKEIKNDLTKFAFDNSLNNPLKFKKELKDEIAKSLK